MEPGFLAPTVLPVLCQNSPWVFSSSRVGLKILQFGLVLLLYVMCFFAGWGWGLIPKSTKSINLSPYHLCLKPKLALVNAFWVADSNEKFILSFVFLFFHNTLSRGPAYCGQTQVGMDESRIMKVATDLDMSGLVYRLSSGNPS